MTQSSAPADTPGWLGRPSQPGGVVLLVTQDTSWVACFCFSLQVRRVGFYCCGRRMRRQAEWALAQTALSSIRSADRRICDHVREASELGTCRPPYR
jgi:hypothetical protein